ncbi:hypothetical protein BH24CHL7_BH24CHL7_02200 [soil metagenome]
MTGELALAGATLGLMDDTYAVWVMPGGFFARYRVVMVGARGRRPIDSRCLQGECFEDPQSFGGPTRRVAWDRPFPAGVTPPDAAAGG